LSTHILSKKYKKFRNFFYLFLKYRYLYHSRDAAGCSGIYLLLLLEKKISRAKMTLYHTTCIMHVVVAPSPQIQALDVCCEIGACGDPRSI
jgi:hypothetical protein